MMCKVVGGLALVCLLSGFRLAVAQNAVPFVNTPLVPGAVAPGGPGFMLAVHGTGFVSGLKSNGTARRLLLPLSPAHN